MVVTLRHLIPPAGPREAEKFAFTVVVGGAKQRQEVEGEVMSAISEVPSSSQPIKQRGGRIYQTYGGVQTPRRLMFE